jgi:hypothetical protein
MSKQEFQAAVVYLLVTFPLAALWHVVLFGSWYESLGYFGREPSFVLGFVAIVIQAVVLAIAYGRTVAVPGGVGSHWGFIGLAGVFLWASNVVAFAAKVELSSPPLFFLLETGYFTVNFALYGLLLPRVFGRR